MGSESSHHGRLSIPCNLDRLRDSYNFTSQIQDTLNPPEPLNLGPEKPIAQQSATT